MTGQTIILGTERALKDLVRVAVHAPPGSVATVKPPTRTLDQNAKMQAMLGDISRQKPGGRVLAPDQWKCLFMDATAKETNNASFTSKWEPSLDGEGVVNTGYRSSRLNKSEMGDLISFIDAWGTKKGIVWSEPEQEERAA